MELYKKFYVIAELIRYLSEGVEIIKIWEKRMYDEGKFRGTFQEP